MKININKWGSEKIIEKLQKWSKTQKCEEEKNKYKICCSNVVCIKN